MAAQQNADAFAHHTASNDKNAELEQQLQTCATPDDDAAGRCPPGIAVRAPAGSDAIRNRTHAAVRNERLETAEFRLDHSSVGSEPQTAYQGAIICESPEETAWRRRWHLSRVRILAEQREATRGHKGPQVPTRGHGATWGYKRLQGATRWIPGAKGRQLRRSQHGKHARSGRRSQHTIIILASWRPWCGTKYDTGSDKGRRDHNYWITGAVSVRALGGRSRFVTKWQEPEPLTRLGDMTRAISNMNEQLALDGKLMNGQQNTCVSCTTIAGSRRRRVASSTSVTSCMSICTTNSSSRS